MVCVLELSKINGYAKERLIEEGISFVIQEKQIYLQEFYQQFWQKNNLEVRYLSYIGSQLNADNLPKKR